MNLLFIYGPPAAGKLTVAREIAARTGFALFHNHLVVDAVAAVFPFGSPAFVRLRERFWLDMFAEAAAAGRSTIFTFAPEATVTVDFPKRARTLVESNGGHVSFVALQVPPAVQEQRLDAPDRAAFGKLRSIDLLRELRSQFDACEAAMPAPEIVIDTSAVSAGDAAGIIIGRLGLSSAG